MYVCYACLFQYFTLMLKEKQTYISETSTRARCQGVVTIPPQNMSSSIIISVSGSQEY